MNKHERTDIILHMRVEWFSEHYPGEKFHALLCDPPYELGFMGKAWDDTGIAHRPDTWAGLAEHLHSGGFGMAFASSRGWHRLAVAIEDAGLIIHPSIFGWANGQGFPKAKRVKDEGEDEPAFTGHRYGLQALKPALEPIIVFQKPYDSRPVDDITATGAGALNIDGGRVNISEHDPNFRTSPSNTHIPFESPPGEYENNGYGKRTALHPHADSVRHHAQGRWPSNLLLLDNGAAAALDAQSGERPSKSGKPGRAGNGTGVTYLASKPTGTEHGDTGGASRFFYRVRTALDAADPVLYTAKSSRSEREAGLAEFPMMVGEGHIPQAAGRKYAGTNKRFSRANHHPTVKPLDLTRYLATLLLPPDEYKPRRIMIPFAGSGSECIGAWQAGWDEIVGIEFRREYVDIARARFEYWKRMGVQLDFIDDLTT